MSRRRLRRREKAQRHLPAPSGVDVALPPIIREAARVERLAYTRTQAAQALGISRSTFIRRVLPFVETIETGWGARLIPVDEVERFVAERRRNARTKGRPPPGRPGRKTGLPAELVERIRREHADGKTLGEIARGLNTDCVPTSQGGRQWWSSTVRSALIRSRPTNTARAVNSTTQT
jgi:hypothetical protein